MKTLLLLTLPAWILLAGLSFDEGVATGAGPSQAGGVCAANPDHATPDVNQVDTPKAGDSVSSPVTVRGRILAFEATFKVKIFDAAGNTLADVQGMSSEGSVLSPFEVQVPFSVTAAIQACMWVFEESARDGSPDNVRQIPLQLLPAGGLPPTGGTAQADSAFWSAVALLGGMLVLVLGVTAGVVALKRR